MTAHYHQQGKAPLLCEIVTTHENGTVDLRRIGGSTFVTECEVVDAPQHGYATLIEEKPKKSTRKQSASNEQAADSEAAVHSPELPSTEAEAAAAK